VLLVHQYKYQHVLGLRAAVLQLLLLCYAVHAKDALTKQEVE